jgi:hypothetical protein
MKIALITAVVATLVVGCGSSGSTSTVTVSQPVSSAPATTKAGKTTVKQEFLAFLAKVQPIRKHGNDLIDKCNAAFDAMNSTADTTWDPAAACAKRSARVDTRAADKLAAIVPPAGLKHPWMAYVRSWRNDALIDQDLYQTIHAHQFLNWNDFNARFNKRADAVTAFRVAVIAYAASHGNFGIPGWVHHIGG